MAPSERTDSLPRRAYLGASGVAAVAVLAGCLGNGDDDASGDPSVPDPTADDDGTGADDGDGATDDGYAPTDVEFNLVDPEAPLPAETDVELVFQSDSSGSELENVDEIDVELHTPPGADDPFLDLIPGVGVDEDGVAIASYDFSDHAGSELVINVIHPATGEDLSSMDVTVEG